MVYRGKPSKACLRCRERRLKCDLQPNTCSQCFRANAICSGYRNTEQLRFQHETQSITNKVTRLATNPSQLEPRYFPLPIDTQARDVFFNHYVSSSCWEFFKPYYHPHDSPNPLTLAIEAASLAFLWHQVNSETALLASRQRYTLALRMTNNLLRSYKEATKDTTLLTTLLFDVYEKITTDPRCQGTKAQASHISGALALVKLRGLDHFKEPSQVQILQRIESHSVSSSIITGSLPSDTLLELRHHLDTALTSPTPLTNLASAISKIMLNYGRLRRESREGILSRSEFIQLSADLDDRFEDLVNGVPANGIPTTTHLTEKSDRCFHGYYHVYAHRNVCTTMNMLRVARIGLNESLLEHYTSIETVYSEELARKAETNITRLVNEILASIPRYTDCSNGAVDRLPPESLKSFTSSTSSSTSTSTAANKSLSHDLSSSKAIGHTKTDAYAWPQILPGQLITPTVKRGSHAHSPRHVTDCHILLWPMYAAGRAKINFNAHDSDAVDFDGVSGGDVGSGSEKGEVKAWILKEFKYMADHFGLRNAEIVRGILEDGESDMDAWEVYGVLGGYAFNA